MSEYQSSQFSAASAKGAVELTDVPHAKRPICRSAMVPKDRVDTSNLLEIMMLWLSAGHRRACEITAVLEMRWLTTECKIGSLSCTQ